MNTQSIANIKCPLCNGSSNLYFQKTKPYYLCSVCNGLFLDRSYLPDKDEELSRYKEHNNDVNDPRYQKFVSPITSNVLQDFTPNHKGLDFGSGSGPVISKVLTENGFSVRQYDPYFANYPALLCEKYDYIICCEVIEHFYKPNKEFILIKNLLNPGGKLYCMTDLFSEEINFEKWYYKDDPTHVFFYHHKTLLWIKEMFGFSEVTVNGRLVVFTAS